MKYIFIIILVCCCSPYKQVIRQPYQNPQPAYAKQNSKDVPYQHYQVRDENYDSRK